MVNEHFHPRRNAVSGGFRGVLWVIALLCVMPTYFGCAQRKSAQLQKGIAPPDRTLFETGDAYLKKGQYVRARLAFQTLLNTYPDSDIASDAYFAMGDTFYEEGGTENLLQAENQYKDFIIFFPGDPKAADAQMKIISLNMGMMRTPDRDQQYARRTLQEIETLLRRYPNSDYVPIVNQLKVTVEDNLARGDLGVAEFYLKRGNLSGTIQRLQYITENFKNFEEMDRVYYRIAELWESVRERSAADPDATAQAALNAAAWYAKVAEGFPFSDFYETSKKRLTEMGLEIPEVDAALAAANKANIRPGEGFSPLKPLIDFGKALGFIAPPDQYEVARKTLEEEKQAAAKSAAETRAGSGDDIQIELEMRKSASDGPIDETSAPPAGSGGSSESPDVSPASAGDESRTDDAGQQSKPGRYQRKPQQR